MAQRVQVILEDDIDGGAATESVTFTLDGVTYEIDLNEANVSSLRDAFAPYVSAHLDDLSDRVHESCSIAVLDDADVVYVARVSARRLMTVAIHVGTRFPAYLTSMGRVLLAELDQDAIDSHVAAIEWKPRTSRTVTEPTELRKELVRVSKQGWALVDQELEMGLRSIAAPLRDANGQAVAALNISASARRGNPDEIRKDLLPELLAAAHAIENDLVLVSRLS